MIVMGVQGLWRLLMPIGRRISIETLEGKILAVDASIWLTQFLSAMKDPESGKVRPAAHLIGFFRRLCKLRYHGIRPVFVFDGATPEIKQRELRDRRKRREQFSNHHSEDAIQKMAKRLLIQQIKKRGSNISKVAIKKKIGETNKNASGTASPTTEADTTTASAAFAPGFYDPEMDKADEKQPMREDEKVDEIIEVLEDEVDYLKQATAEVNEQSDWDTPIIDVETGQSASESQQNESTGDQGRDGDVRDYASVDPNDFDPKYIASLPSARRKDLVENAQRNRRLQSRREFMKVASDPEGLSKCQLQNFLRSSHLNKKIQTMAQEASKVEELNNIQASGRSKRIIFETDDAVDDQETKKTKKEEELKKFRQNRKLSVLASSDEDSDDGIDWEEDRGDRSHSFHIAASKPKALLDDSESDDESHGGGFLKSSSAAKVVQNIDQQIESSKVARLPRRRPDLHNKNSDNDSDEDNHSDIFTGGQKFITAENMSIQDDRKMPAEPSQPGTDREKMDVVAAQELEDEILARALQEDESDADEGEGGFLRSIGSLNRTTSIEAEGLGTREVDVSPSSSEEDEIEWEDGENSINGDDRGPEQQEKAGEVLIENTYTHEDTHLSPASPGGGRNPSSDEDTLKSALLRSRKSIPSEVIHVNDTDSQADEGDSVTSSKSTLMITEDLELAKECVEKKMNQSHGDVDDPWSYGSPTKVTRAGRTSNEVTIALEQAQATAANLTNWAGRAFRQAVVQHAAENGLSIPTITASVQSSAPYILATANKDNLESGSALQDNIGVQTMRHAATQSSEQIASISPSLQKKGQKEIIGWAEPLGDEAVRKTIEEFQEEWASERSHKNQEIESVTDEMRAEAMNLLQLFGVPYVEAPAEAEAQCAMLEKLGLVDGIVTEDSDAFVFGGKRVYKNIFYDQKYVEVYDASDAEREMGLTRDGLIALALLLGGDYTEGVKGVGIINGMEIIQAFDVSQDVKSGLDKFRRWLDGFDPSDSLSGAKEKGDGGVVTKGLVFHRKHHSARTRWTAPKFFPDPKVLNAYSNPVVETSEEKFTWGIPDMDRLVLFCSKFVGWPPEETKSMIKPVIEKVENGKAMHQTRMDSYMRYEDGHKFANIRSKRLREVLDNVKRQQGSSPSKKARTEEDDKEEKKHDETSF